MSKKPTKPPKPPKPPRRKRKHLPVAVTLRLAAERRAVDLAVLSDRMRRAALKGDEVDLRALVALEEAAALAATQIGSDKKTLARAAAGGVAADCIEVRFVPSDFSLWQSTDAAGRQTFVVENWSEICRIAVGLKLLPPGPRSV